MRADLNFNPLKNTIINAARVNASVAKHNTKDGKTSGNHMRSGRVTLSPQGKLMSMIENLTKQKEALIERKNDLVETTLKEGGEKAEKAEKHSIAAAAENGKEGE